MSKFVALHLGLGDHIICSGLVNYLSKKEKVIIPCYEHNRVSVDSFYKGNDNVEVFTVADDKDVAILAQEYNSIVLNGDNFPKGFYQQTEVAWTRRWSECPIWDASRSVKQLSNSERKVFIHDDRKRGFEIQGISGLVIIPDSDSILIYIDLICDCKEIHCIDSSFLHLIECISPDKFTNNPEFFYHKSSRPNSTDYTDCLRYNWKVV